MDKEQESVFDNWTDQTVQNFGKIQMEAHLNAWAGKYCLSHEVTHPAHEQENQ